MKKLTGRQIRIMRLIVVVGASLSGIVLMFSAFTGHWLIWPAMIVLIGLLAADLILCRCPHCGRYLRYFPLSEERCFCPYCGRELD